MNWTGGRLNRHAKSSNDNTTYWRRQRFARRKHSRLQHIVDAFNTKILSDNRHDGHQQALGHAPVARENCSSTRSGLFTQSTACFSDVPKGESHTSGRDINPAGEKTGRYQDDISAAKVRLLSKPDWLKLAACTSMKLRFPGEYKMSNIGKRRRMGDYHKPWAQDAFNAQPTAASIPSLQRQVAQTSQSCPGAGSMIQLVQRDPMQSTSSYFPLPSSPPVIQHRSVSPPRPPTTTAAQIVLHDSERSSYVLDEPPDDDGNCFLPCLTDLRGLEGFDAIRERPVRDEIPVRSCEAIQHPAERLDNGDDVTAQNLDKCPNSLLQADREAQCWTKEPSETSRSPESHETLYTLRQPSITDYALKRADAHQGNSELYFEPGLWSPSTPTVGPAHFMSDAHMRRCIDKQFDSSGLTLDLNPVYSLVSQAFPTKKRRYDQAFGRAHPPLPGTIVWSSANKTRRPLLPAFDTTEPYQPAAHDRANEGATRTDPFVFTSTSPQYLPSSNSMHTPTHKPRVSLPQRQHRQSSMFPRTCSRARR